MIIMSFISTNEFKPGVKILMDGNPCSIIENEFVKPGKGQAFNRVRLRNLKTGRMIEKTLKSGETFELADIADFDAEFLYSDGEYWHFMHSETFEQFQANEAIVVDAIKWIKPQDVCIVTLFNNEPLSISPPTFVELLITETDPGVRGDTSGGGSKPATLETGAVVKIPLFVQQGEIIRVDTRTGEYASRVKS
jgi:elongation factor P